MAEISDKENNSSSSSTVVMMINTPPTTKTKMKRTRKIVPRDSSSTGTKRTSSYRGVTRHRLTGRYEAHLWDKDSWNESKTKKGRQVYLGAYGEEEAAARAYDLAALKYWGQQTLLNFQLAKYEEELKEMEGQSKEEYVANLRRKSTGFSRGASKYRGVARHHHNGRWEARIGRVYGHKYLYLGTYDTEEAAAKAYDMAAIEFRGRNAVTNFDISRYLDGPSPPKKQNIGKEQLQLNNIVNVSNTAENLPAGITQLEASSGNDHDIMINVPSCMHEENFEDSLDMLLKSPKIEEMVETTSASSGSPQSTCAELPRRIFPDDIQTYFDSPGSSGYDDPDDNFIFGDLKLLTSPIFQCEFEF